MLRPLNTRVREVRVREGGSVREGRVREGVRVREVRGREGGRVREVSEGGSECVWSEGGREAA